jgi:hypothetical protein
MGTMAPIVSASSISCSGGSAEAGADFQSLFNGVEDLRMAVAQEQRSPGAHVIDVLVAVDVENARALAARDEGRRTADAAPRANGGVDAPWDDPQGTFKELLRFGKVHFAVPRLGSALGVDTLDDFESR